MAERDVAKLVDLLEMAPRVAGDGTEWWDGYAAGRKDAEKSVRALISQAEEERA